MSKYLRYILKYLKFNEKLPSDFNPNRLSIKEINIVNNKICEINKKYFSGSPIRLSKKYNVQSQDIIYTKSSFSDSEYNAKRLIQQELTEMEIIQLFKKYGCKTQYTDCPKLPAKKNLVCKSCHLYPKEFVSYHHLSKEEERLKKIGCEKQFPDCPKIPSLANESCKKCLFFQDYKKKYPV